MARKSNRTITSEELSELEQLRARIAQLEKTENKDEEFVPNEEKIQQDEYISVMSLVPFNLNLSTKESGQGIVKKFTKFGEVKKILYRDLLDIMDANPNFLENGYFYIMHPAFIRQNGLDEIYSKILTKNKIEKILSTGEEDCVTLYESANSGQQEIIVQLLISKVKENPDSVNLNIVDKISRLSKTDIVKLAEEIKESTTENK